MFTLKCVIYHVMNLTYYFSKIPDFILFEIETFLKIFYLINNYFYYKK